MKKKVSYSFGGFFFCFFLENRLFRKTETLFQSFLLIIVFKCVFSHLPKTWNAAWQGPTCHVFPSPRYFISDITPCLTISVNNTHSHICMAFGYNLIANFRPNMCFNCAIDDDLADLIHTVNASNIKTFFFNCNKLESRFRWSFYSRSSNPGGFLFLADGFVKHM